MWNLKKNVLTLIDCNINSFIWDLSINDKTLRYLIILSTHFINGYIGIGSIIMRKIQWFTDKDGFQPTAHQLGVWTTGQYCHNIFSQAASGLYSVVYNLFVV